LFSIFYLNILRIKNITEEVTKDTEFLNELCRGKNLSILSNKSCGNILSKDLAALVNIDKSENKSTSTTPDSEKSHSSFENKKKSLTPEAEVKFVLYLLIINIYLFIYLEKKNPLILIIKINK